MPKAVELRQTSLGRQKSPLSAMNGWWTGLPSGCVGWRRAAAACRECICCNGAAASLRTRRDAACTAGHSRSTGKCLLDASIVHHVQYMP